MADFEEEQEQSYFNDAYPGDSDLPSSPGSSALHDHRTPIDDDDYGAHASEDESQQVIEDTQFDDLEPDTQTHHSSFLVPETQFDLLEKDTQAIDGPITFAASHTTVSSSQLESGSLIKRPELPDINNAQDGFKFGPAQPWKQQPSKRPQATPLSAATDLRASVVPEPSPDFNRHAHGKCYANC